MIPGMAHTSDDATEQEAPETLAEAVAEVSGLTAFILLKKPDGNWKVVTDLTSPFAVSGASTMGDIKQGCREILDAIKLQEVAWAVSERLKPKE